MGGRGAVLLFPPLSMRIYLARGKANFFDYCDLFVSTLQSCATGRIRC